MCRAWDGEQRIAQLVGQDGEELVLVTVGLGQFFAGLAQGLLQLLTFGSFGGLVQGPPHGRHQAHPAGP